MSLPLHHEGKISDRRLGGGKSVGLGSLALPLAQPIAKVLLLVLFSHFLSLPGSYTSCGGYSQVYGLSLVMLYLSPQIFRSQKDPLWEQRPKTLGPTVMSRPDKKSSVTFLPKTIQQNTSELT